MSIMTARDDEMIALKEKLAISIADVKALTKENEKLDSHLEQFKNASVADVPRMARILFGEPVRPDIHRAVREQKERLEAVVKKIGEHFDYGVDLEPTSADFILEYWDEVDAADILWDICVLVKP